MVCKRPFEAMAGHMGHSTRRAFILLAAAVAPARYGAASGVTCGNMPGQLYHEDIDAATYADWCVASTPFVFKLYCRHAPR